MSGTGAWAVVPAKGFSRAKTRLSPLLEPRGRAELARAMLSDVLGVLAHAQGLAGILVVSGDAEVARMAADYGVATLMEPMEAGTNAAVQRGLDHLKEVGAERCIVVQADIPFLAGHEFASILAALERAPLAIAPAKRDGGTNMLALAAPDLIAPAFGEDSFKRHFEAAAQLGLAVDALDLRGAGHDIDVPTDLSFDPEPGTGTHTQAVLSRLLPALDKACPK